MKLLKIISLMSLIFYLPLSAEEQTSVMIPIIQEAIPIEEPISTIEETTIVETESNQDITLQELIEEVKNAPDEQKRVLMNQLKTKLKTMNEESRHKAITELKKSFIKKEIHTKGQKQQKDHETAQHGNHQPKFRHLQQRMNNNSSSQPGRGGGSGHQGNGSK